MHILAMHLEDWPSHYLWKVGYSAKAPHQQQYTVSDLHNSIYNSCGALSYRNTNSSPLATEVVSFPWAKPSHISRVQCRYGSALHARLQTPSYSSTIPAASPYMSHTWRVALALPHELWTPESKNLVWLLSLKMGYPAVGCHEKRESGAAELRGVCVIPVSANIGPISLNRALRKISPDILVAKRCSCHRSPLSKTLLCSEPAYKSEWYKEQWIKIVFRNVGLLAAHCWWPCYFSDD